MHRPRQLDERTRQAPGLCDVYGWFRGQPETAGPLSFARSTPRVLLPLAQPMGEGARRADEGLCLRAVPNEGALIRPVGHLLPSLRDGRRTRGEGATCIARGSWMSELGKRQGYATYTDGSGVSQKRRAHFRLRDPRRESFSRWRSQWEKVPEGRMRASVYEQYRMKEPSSGLSAIFSHPCGTGEGLVARARRASPAALHPGLRRDDGIEKQNRRSFAPAISIPSMTVSSE